MNFWQLYFLSYRQKAASSTVPFMQPIKKYHFIPLKPLWPFHLKCVSPHLLGDMGSRSSHGI